MRFDRKTFAVLLGLSGALAAAPAAAGETRYEYDARGRLGGVSQTGIHYYDARYSYDKADNRLSHTVSGAGTAVVIVPKSGGYRVIPLGG